MKIDYTTGNDTSDVSYLDTYFATSLNEVWIWDGESWMGPRAANYNELLKKRQQRDAINEFESDDHSDQPPYVKSLTLNLDDPFEGPVADIVELNRRKRSDYASEDDIFINFRRSASMMSVEGFDYQEAILFNITQKIARLQALREQGKLHDPSNESVEDTYKDIAVYAVLLYASQKVQ